MCRDSFQSLISASIFFNIVDFRVFQAFDIFSRQNNMAVQQLCFSANF